MRYVAIDTETYLITEDNKQPDIVCLSVCEDGEPPELFGAEHVYDVLCHLLKQDFIFVLQNAPFDFGVLIRAFPNLESEIWRLYEDGRVRDVGIVQKLLDLRVSGLSNEKGAYSLGGMVERYLPHKLDKGVDSWRMRYAELAGVPVVEWPPSAVKYAIEDAEYTLQVYKAQQRLMAKIPLPPNEIQRQVKAHWALHLTSLRGLRTDGEAVAKLDTELDVELKQANEILIAAEIFHKDKKNGGLKLSPKGAPTKNMAAIKGRVEKAYAKLGLTAPCTDKGNICTDETTLSESGDHILETLASISGISKIKTSYMPLLQACITKRIQTNFNPLLETGRTSSYKPNVQQWPRKGSVRECLIPEPGHVFVSCDYDTLELRCIAQVLLWRFGSSKMADAIRAGRDLHLMVAAQLAGVDYETAKVRYDEDDEELVDKRQMSKVANFGFCGGMGPDTFVQYAAGVALSITRDEAFNLRQRWLDTWPEMNQYFRLAGEHTGDFGDKRLQCWVSGREVAGVSFSAYCNYQFQALAADGAKASLYETVRRCRLDITSSMYGSHPYNFIHDQIILESPVDKAAAAGRELCEVMVSEMQRWTPDVPISASPVLMERWYKGAKTVLDDRGELQIWRPKA
jgi:DNA polymerase I-like protein with 3'-5' exonuclease and polymerase domains